MVLTWSTELAAFRGNFGNSTLLHLAGFTDGTASILGIVEARSSPGGEGVLVVWYSLTPLTHKYSKNYNIKKSNHLTILDLGF